MSADGLREAVDADAADLQALVGGVFDEYPGCVLDLDDLDADLLAPRSAHAVAGGRLWVVEHDERVVACVGVGAVGVDGELGHDLPGRVVELKRLYVDAHARGRGLGGALVDHVHTAAATLGATAVELWSDTRFAAGHRRYLAAGYEPRSAERELHDPSDTTEQAFWQRLRPDGPTATRTWLDGDGVRDRTTHVAGRHAHRVAGTRLTRSSLVEHELVTDEDWRTRRLTVRRDGTLVLDLRSDGLGGWWRDAAPLAELDGCVDVELPGTIAPLAAALGRRAEATVGGEPDPEPVVRWDPTTDELTAVSCTWVRRGPTTWFRTTPDGTTIVTTDGTTLPLSAGTTRPVE